MRLLIEEIETCLKTRTIGRKCYLYDKIDSTNEQARQLAASGAGEGTIVVAEQQTAGKGRHGRGWESEAGRNLLFTIILRPAIPPDKIGIFPFLTAVAIAEAVEQETALAIRCKWPNDLLIGKRKLGGILIEGSTKDRTVEYVVVGIGINVGQREFAPPLNETATSILTEAGTSVDRTKLLCRILLSIEERYEQLFRSGPDPIVASWIERTDMINRPVRVDVGGRIVAGVMAGVSPEGGLLLDTEKGRTIIHAGDTTTDPQNQTTPE